MSGTRWQRWRQGAARVSQNFVGMCALVAFLAIAESGGLWWFGANYEPLEHIRRVGVLDFTLSDDARWAASRLIVERAAMGTAYEFSIIMHDVLRTRHAYPLNLGRRKPVCMAISPSGDYVAFSTFDSALCLASRRPGAVLRTIDRTPRDVLTKLAWTHDGKFLVAVGSKIIYVWSVPDGELLHKLDHGCNIATLSVSHDPPLLLSAGDNRALLLWDVCSGKRLRTISTANGITSAVISGDGNLVAVTSAGGLSVWDLDQEAELWSAPPSIWRRFPLAFTPDGHSVANVELQMGDGRRTVHIVFRGTRTGRIINTLDTECDQITGIRFTPSGTLCSWDYQGAIVGWDLARQRKTWHLSCRDYVSSTSQSSAKVGREPGPSAG